MIESILQQKFSQGSLRSVFMCVATWNQQKFIFASNIANSQSRRELLRISADYVIRMHLLPDPYLR